MSGIDPERLEQLVADLLDLGEVERTRRLQQLGQSDRALADLATRLLRRARAAPESGPASGGLPTPPDEGLLAPGSAPERDPLEGATLGEFTLTRLLGAGGMGRVYEARQRAPERRVAVKVLSSRFAQPSAVRRFVQEGEVLATLQHPGICRVIAAGSAVVGVDSVPYLAMEFVDGGPIVEAVAALPTQARLGLLAEVCDAVEHAHRKGILHRDLKPANILVESDQGRARARVVDFGLARVLAEGVAPVTDDARAVLGTVDYMSPEQLAEPRSAPDTRTDVYALGILLYELLAGRRPFQSESQSTTVAKILAAAHTPRLRDALPGIHTELDLIVAKATARDPDRRYGSAAALAQDLRAHLERRPIAAHPPTTAYRMRKFALRHRGLALGLLLAALTLSLGVAGTLYGLREAVLARDEARAALTASRFGQYQAALQAAQSAVKLGDLARARAHLAAAPAEHRGWEWRYLGALSVPPAQSGPGTGGLRTVSFEMMIGSNGERPLNLDRVRGLMCLVDLDRLEPTDGIPGFSEHNPWRSAFTEDGRHCVTAGNALAGNITGLRVFDRSRRCLVAERLDYEFEDRGFALSRDGRRVAIGGRSGKVRIFTIPELQPVLEVQDLPDIAGLAFSPDGTVILVTAEPRGATFLRVGDGSVIARCAGIESRLDWPRFSADGTRVYALMYQDQTLVEIDVARGVIVRRVVVPGHPSLLATLPDGSRVLVAALDGTVHFYPTRPPEGVAWVPMLSLREHPVALNLMYVCPDSRRVFVDSTSEADFVWDAGGR